VVSHHLLNDYFPFSKKVVESIQRGSMEYDGLTEHEVKDLFEKMLVKKKKAKIWSKVKHIYY
jgi:hypothetical protein